MNNISEVSAPHISTNAYMDFAIETQQTQTSHFTLIYGRGARTQFCNSAI